MRCDGKYFSTLTFESIDNDPLELQANSRETLNLVNFYIKTNSPCIMNCLFCLCQSSFELFIVLCSNILNDAHKDFDLSLHEEVDKDFRYSNYL